LDIKDKIKNIRLLLLDVDGVLTNGEIAYGFDDLELKTFNVKDGLGIKLAISAGLKIGIITGRGSEALDKRVAELGIEIFYQKVRNKIIPFEDVKRNLSIENEQIAYVGDDLNDLKVMKQVGLKCTVADAAEDIKDIADYITKKSGGKGAVREVIELVLRGQGKWEQSIENFLKGDE